MYCQPGWWGEGRVQKSKIREAEKSTILPEPLQASSLKQAQVVKRENNNAKYELVLNTDFRIVV